MPRDRVKSNPVYTAGFSFAVHLRGANTRVMLFLALSLALAQTPPNPLFTDAHQRVIGCVAFFGVVASRQREGQRTNLVDVRNDGPRWAGLVGTRIVAETALPRAVIGFAIQEAVPAAQRLFQLTNPQPSIEARQAECLPLMQADLAAEAKDAPLPMPLSSPLAKPQH
jgi:hypothetical protein